MRRTLSVLGVLGLCVLVAGAQAQTEPGESAETEPARVKITVGRETTYLLGPLHADGTVDYVKAYDEEMSKGLTWENNAYTPLLEIFGPRSFDTRLQAKYMERLGFKELPANGDYFVRWDDFAKEIGVSKEQKEDFWDQISDAMRKPWKTNEQPELAKWLGRNEAALNKVVEATKRERYYSPALGSSDSVAGIGLPGLGFCREAANALAARAMLRAGEGKLEAAWQDSLAVHRLGRLLSQTGSLIEGMVGCGINGVGVRADEGIISTNQLTQEQATECLKDLGKLGPLGNFKRAVNEMERFMSLDTITMMARGKWKEVAPELSQSPESREDLDLVKTATEQRQQVDWDALLRQVNAHYDAMMAEAEKATFEDRHEGLAELERESSELFKEGLWRDEPDLNKRLSGFINKFYISYASIVEMNTLYERALMNNDLDEIGFALAAERGRTGKYPETLDGLAPGYFKSVPVDRFTDEPLHYRVVDNGFLLYSVDVDEEDNAGIEIPAKGKEQRDLVFRVGK